MQCLVFLYISCYIAENCIAFLTVCLDVALVMSFLTTVQYCKRKKIAVAKTNIFCSKTEANSFFNLVKHKFKNKIKLLLRNKENVS